MAKEKERKLAQILYCEQGKTAKEIAGMVGVSENTLTSWVDKGNWKEIRAAKLSATKVQTDNLRSIINDLAAERLELSTQLKVEKGEEQILVIREQLARIDDSVSKWNKTLESVSKSGTVSLKDTITVIEDLMKDMSAEDHQLYLKVVDYANAYINKVASKL